MRLIIATLLIFVLLSNTLIVNYELIQDGIIELVDYELESDKEEKLELDFKIVVNGFFEVEFFDSNTPLFNQINNDEEVASLSRDILTPPPEFA